MITFHTYILLEWIIIVIALCRLQGCKNCPAPCPDQMSYNYTILLFISPLLCIFSFCCYVFCLLVVLVKLSVLAKWLARKTPLKKPNRGEGIIFREPRQKSADDFLGLLYCFIVLLCICVVSCPYMIYFPTFMARYSQFVLNVLLNPKQTNKQTYHVTNINWKWLLYKNIWQKHYHHSVLTHFNQHF